MRRSKYATLNDMKAYTELASRHQIMQFIIKSLFILELALQLYLNYTGVKLSEETFANVTTAKLLHAVLLCNTTTFILTIKGSKFEVFDGYRQVLIYLCNIPA